MEQQQLERYRVDHLILLVGGNPLPNYVAARVLARPGATLHFVHTAKVYEVARRLADTLTQPAENALLGGDFSAPQWISVDATNPFDIFDKVKRLAESLPYADRVGLNYTGGNRPMSVHAYDAVEEARDNAIFSYLDASRLSMLIHDKNRTTRSERVDTSLNMRLETLFKLHGLKEKPNLKPSEQPSSTTLQPDLAAVLAELHATSGGAKIWFEWGGKKFDNKSANWTKLPKGEPGLEKVEAALREMCGGQEPTPEGVALALRQPKLSSCAKWFQGEWLENHVLSELQKAIVGRNDTNDAVMGIKRIREGKGDESFELDVVVMRSYQLFAFSCIASAQKPACKEHLMEAYVRARQMGGDEARIGLVCAYPDALKLQNEIASDLDASGKIKVFGQTDLMSLKTKISEWLNQQP